jgi:hypothetical protein
MTTRTYQASVADRLRSTLGSAAWVRQHQGKLCALIPVIWTRANEPEFLLRFGLGLKLLGVNWSDPGELLVAIHWLDHIGLVDTLPLSTLGGPASGLGQLFIRRPAGPKG